MNFSSEYNKLRKKRLEEEKKRQQDANAPLAPEPVYDGWFKPSGAFDDDEGNRFTDVMDTFSASVQDVSANVLRGVGNLGEGLTDALLYGVSGASKALGADTFADKTKSLAEEDSINDFFDWYGEFTGTKEKSVFADKSDNVAQGLGQVAGIILTGGIGQAAGLGTAGVSALTTGTMGLSSLGGGMSEAYQSGATDGEALAYGAIKGAVDAGSEMIFGGLGKAVKALGLSRGLSSVDDMFAKKLSDKISNMFFKNGNMLFKNLVQGGVKASAEGLEEVIAGLGTAVAKKLTYMSDEDLGQLVKDEKLLDQFVVGAVTSGIAQAGDVYVSTKQGQDLVTGLNANEQKVVDHVYKERLAEEEKSGKLSAKKKNTLYEAVISDMDNGRISIDTIEEVLGGETYKSYKDTVDSEESMKKELDELRQMKNGDRNDIQNDRLAELKAMDFSDTSKRDGLKNQLSQEVFDLAKGTRLSESYNEKTRRSQAYEADLTKYSAKQQEIVKRAVDSGILNNTRRTHEFVDLIAKISADKGVLFDFANNERLKESGFALEGKTVNGFVKDGNITLNINSAKALNSVVGHEIAHVLEGTELYTELQQAVKNYATTKGEYDTRLQELTKLYEGVEGADINAEITADLVGDYLFTDSKFVNHLSTEHRNIFQKIFDEIKYLLKTATAGSKEARELEKVKRVFEQVWRETSKPTDNDGVKYGISSQSPIDLSGNDELSQRIGGKRGTEKYKVIQEYILENLGEQPIKLSDGKMAVVDRSDAQHIARNAGNKKVTQISEIKSIVENAELVAEEESTKERKFDYFHYYEAYVKFGEDTYPIYLNVGRARNDSSYHIYDITQKLRDTVHRINDVGRPVGNAVETVPLTDSISQNTENATKYSLSGVDARTADKNALLKAHVMTNQGASELEIFRETGWFRGVDGKWRFEIDDSQAKVYVRGDAKLMENDLYREYQDLMQDFLYGFADEKTAERLREIEGSVKRLKDSKKVKTVSDFLDHPALFEAYPSLADMPVEVSEVATGKRGSYNVLDGITISKKIANEASEIVFKKTLLHELQHVIQHYERFAGGANVETWKGIDIRENSSKFHSAMKRMDEAFEGGTEEFKYLIRQLNQMQIKQDFGDEYTRIENELFEKYEERYSEYDNAHFEAMLYKDGSESLSDFQKYQMTAGEVEARETENRSQWDEEARRNKLPARETEFGVIFAENKKNPFEFSENRYSLSQNEDIAPIPGGIYGKDLALEAPIRSDVAPAQPAVDVETREEVDPEIEETETLEGWLGEDLDKPITTVKQRLEAKLNNLNTELSNNQRLRAESADSLDEKIAKLQSEYDAKKNKDTKYANNLLRRIESLKRRKADVDADYAKRISDIESRIRKTTEEVSKDHTKTDQLEAVYRRIDKQLEWDKKEATKELRQKRDQLEAQLKDKNAYVSKSAKELYIEITHLKKGIRASEQLGYILDQRYDWQSVKRAFLDVKNWPDSTVDPDSAAESAVREMLNEDYEKIQHELDEVNGEIQKQIERLEAEAETKRKNAKMAHQRKRKQEMYAEQMEKLIGDTTTWKDKSLGIQYATTTLRRNLRDVVRDGTGRRDIKKADAIYEELQGIYNNHEAMLIKEANEIKKPYADLKITDAEDKYIQMLGEYRYNPETTLTRTAVLGFYHEHSQDIDRAKVDKAIAMARETYDSLLERLNKVLAEEGMKEIPYRQGYFPHFTEEKQGRLAKILNWKVKNNEIPTDIAGMTEQFTPNRSWQSFNKQRQGDKTDYSFLKGLDTYVQGAMDWIYHIEDIQKRRAFENHIRYVHSDKGKQEKIDAIKANDQYSADEAQALIDAELAEANNPLGNFITDFRTQTNILAGKKNSMDRGMEQLTSRKAYSVMSNISNRVTANMVAGSVSSALTNFIPITQSWGEVSPKYSLIAMADTIRSAYRDDGTIDKSSFLTNRLRKVDNLYKTRWDKISDKAVGKLMEVVDGFTSQTVWRSKYRQNLSEGMSESEAIKNADQFSRGLLGDRSRGEQPTIFDAKNIVAKTLTAFQLEVSNQYGYMLKDMPQDMRNESIGKLVKGYATMFLGAYAYNALYSSLTGRDAAFDPIGILEELFQDLFGDDEEEPVDAILNLTENVLDEVPFVGGLLGGGRIPISSALPYDGSIMDIVEGFGKLTEGDWSEFTTEWLNPFYYLIMPMGGGQVRKTIQGLSMFSDDLPISGSYTTSGNLRFPVEDTPLNRLQAGIFGQWSSQNAQDYIDEGRSPLQEKQIQEFIDVGMTIQDYWEYRDGLKGLKTLAQKADYIDSLDLTTEQKNVLINNIADREEDIDMSDYSDYDTFEEFDYAAKNPERYALSRAIARDFTVYKQYTKALSEIKSDKDENGESISGSRKEKVIDYINNLDAEYGEKIILYKNEYPSDNTYNEDIIEYLNGRDDISYSEMETILKELGFKVSADGTVSWD